MPDLTDQEITEIIATKVMGWTKKIVPNLGRVWFDEDDRMRAFAPRDDDGCLMMAWDKLSETKMLHMQTGYSSEHKSKHCECWFGDSHGMAHFSGGADRRRAMCDCMVKAVS